MKRPHYIRSFFIHIAALLLLLAFGFKGVTPVEEPYQHFITVDFSQADNTQAAPKKSSTKRNVNENKAPKAPSKSNTQSKKTNAAPAPIQEKVMDETELPTSQKPQVTPSEPKTVVDPGPTPEELAEQKREAELAKKKSMFADLLAKSKKSESSNDDNSDLGTETSSNGTTTGKSYSNGNIKGALGNRQVLKVPTIKDDSQKKGRVVVKICVDGSGNVISSEYTMMGSTTSDTYLIGLAEEGVLGYKFSESSNPKECGKVVINFLLK